MEYAKEKLDCLLQEYKDYDDFESSHKAGILLYVYADKLIQLSLQQKKEQEQREIEALQKGKYYVDTKSYKREI